MGMVRFSEEDSLTSVVESYLVAGDVPVEWVSTGAMVDYKSAPAWAKAMMDKAVRQATVASCETPYTGYPVKETSPKVHVIWDEQTSRLGKDLQAAGWVQWRSFVRADPRVVRTGKEWFGVRMWVAPDGRVARVRMNVKGACCHDAECHWTSPRGCPRRRPSFW